jgi:hypothetical protein
MAKHMVQYLQFRITTSATSWYPPRSQCLYLAVHLPGQEIPGAKIKLEQHQLIHQESLIPRSDMEKRCSTWIVIAGMSPLDPCDVFVPWCVQKEEIVWVLCLQSVIWKTTSTCLSLNFRVSYCISCYPREHIRSRNPPFADHALT